MKRVTRISYIFFTGILLAMGVFKLAMPFIVVLFSYLVLARLDFTKRKSISISIFVVLVFLIFYGFGHFVVQVKQTLPDVIRTAVPKILDVIKESGYDVPGLDEVNQRIGEEVSAQVMYFAGVAKVLTRDIVTIIIALVIATAVFANGQIDLDRGKRRIENNLYSLLTLEIQKRFWSFYKSFETVMGAQVIISLVNTFATGVFVFVYGFKYAGLLTVITFLCGLLPIVGNIISNTIIFCVGMTMSTTAAIEALVFLIVLHKFEYFLNSQIIGGRIRNPMWLTLLGLLVGEQLMGIPGMILAPVLLNWLKTELAQVEVPISAQVLTP